MATETRRSRLAAWALSLLLLALGAAGGVAADRLLRSRDGERRGPPSPEAIAARLAEDLDLSETQAREVRAIVEGRWRATGAVFERMDPEVEAIRREADDRIRALLDPAQRERFDRRVAEHSRRRAEVRRRLGSAPPPAP